MPQPVDIRIMLFGIVCYSVALFFVDTVQGLVGFTLVSLVFFLILRPPMRRVLKALAAMSPLLIFIACTHVYYHGTAVAIIYVGRLVLLTATTLALSFSYGVQAFTRAFQWLLQPLRVVHLPADDIASAASLALRYIPITLLSYTRIHNALVSRGALLQHGMVARVAFGGHALLALFISMFLHAHKLVDAFDARAYGAGVRTVHSRGAVSAVHIAIVAGICLVCAVLAILA